MALQHIKMQILEIGLLILAAYAGGKVAHKLKIGEVVGQIVGGVLVGPHFLELVYDVLQRLDPDRHLSIFRPIYHFYDGGFSEYAEVLESYHFFVFLFLGIIAFSIGEELHRDRLRQVGAGAACISLLEGLFTFTVSFLGFWLIFRFSLLNALLIGSIGIATAPALTFVLMNKLKVEGRLKNVLANVVVLDDVIEVIAFSIFFGIAAALQRGQAVSVGHLTGDIVRQLLWAIVIGALVFAALKMSIRKRLPREEEQADSPGFLSMVVSEHPTPSVEILVVIMGIVAVGLAVAIEFHLPFLITAVVAGFLVSNFHSHALFDSLKIDNVMPLFNLLFFAIIGSSVRLESFTGDSLIYVVGYLVLRTTGKLIGSWAGCRLTRQDPKVTACLPKLMLPQAGMAAVETILVATALKGAGGETIFNTIIPALVVFELGGAWLSERTLRRWNSWTVGEAAALRAPRAAVDPATLAGLIGDRVQFIEADSRDAAISELGDICVRLGIVPEREVVTNRVREREKLASTGMGDGIALPHCRTGAVTQAVVVCGILRTPVDWEAPDDQPVELAFLILSPEERPEEHLAAIRVVAAALQQHDLKTGLRAALTRGRVADYLRQADG